MNTILVNKSDLERALTVCDVSGQYYLCQDGGIVWGQHQGGFDLPDDVLCPIPVANPDGSGYLYDQCYETLKEIYKDQYFESEYDGNLQSYIFDVICEGESITVFVENNFPEQYKEIEEFLKEEAMDQLMIELESVNSCSIEINA